MQPPKDDLYNLIRQSVRSIPEQSILVVTSKVVAIHQGRCVKIGRGMDRETLAKREADWYVDGDIVTGEQIMFTIKDNTLIASAGVDKSNGNGYLVLWPEKPMAVAREIQQFLKQEFKVGRIGVLITDSHVIPMRRGVVGTALGQFGFNPLRNYIGKPDIFGYKLKVTITNVTEALAAAAVVVMGEGKEQTPLALISDVEGIEFSEERIVNRGQPSLQIPKEEDLFRPMLEKVDWQKGGGGKL